MHKFQKQQIIERFIRCYDGWSNRDSEPTATVTAWVSYIHEAWLFGLINLKDYISLLRVDILKEV